MLLPPFSISLPLFNFFLETNMQNSGLCVFGALQFGPYIYICVASSSLNGDDFNEQAWNCSSRCRYHLSWENLAPLTRDSFSSAMQPNNLIGTHSLFISRKNYACSCEPVESKTRVGSPFTELTKLREGIRQNTA